MAEAPPVVTIKVFRKKRGRRYRALLFAEDFWGGTRSFGEGFAANTRVDAIQKVLDDLHKRAHPSHSGRRPNGMDFARSMVEE